MIKPCFRNEKLNNTDPKTNDSYVFKNVVLKKNFSQLVLKLSSVSPLTALILSACGSDTGQIDDNDSAAVVAPVVTNLTGAVVKGPLSGALVYADADGDGYGDDPTGNSPDAFPLDSSQWDDQDGDGYGDNSAPAILPDDCPNTAGNSSFILLGCIDIDGDGYPNSNDSLPQNPTQWADSDGDGYGDNPTGNNGDAFPTDSTQWNDTDGDGYGDESTGNNPDACPTVSGVSTLDRFGCPDTDSDGASDEDLSGTNGPVWTIADGADILPHDASQQSDTDGDGYGDNGTIGATNPDFFPYNIAAADDNDSDGYPDRWTSSYNGSNALGLVLDGCSGVYGTSTNPLPGCPDSDEDGWANTDDDLDSFLDDLNI